MGRAVVAEIFLIQIVLNMMWHTISRCFNPCNSHRPQVWVARHLRHSFWAFWWLFTLHYHSIASIPKTMLSSVGPYTRLRSVSSISQSSLWPLPIVQQPCRLNVSHPVAVILIYNVDNSVIAFILDHSQAYHLALFASCVEFWVEYSIFPYMRQGNEFQRNCLIGGFILLLFGQSCRTAAMISAASNFSHTIEFSKRDDHFLVTSGMYRFVRHPSYLGWFYWSIATQIVLLNPICFVLYIALSWGFFKDRIPYEEETLMVLFPKEYPEYKRRTVSGIPFI